MIAPLSGTLPRSPYCYKDTFLFPILPPTTYRADMLLRCTIVLSWVLWHSAWLQWYKMRGYCCLFKLETSKRQNPLLFETIGSVVLSSHSFRETVGWVLFFAIPPSWGCYSLAWSNWANEIPILQKVALSKWTNERLPSRTVRHGKIGRQVNDLEIV